MKAQLITTAICATVSLAGCGEGASKGIEPQVYTDSLFAVMKANRTNYTQLIIKRLGPAGSDSIQPIEHWKDSDNGAPLPAQMFRAGAEAVTELTDQFSYSLQSLWPINSQNAPRTDIETQGLNYVANNPGNNFYGEEVLGSVNYFTAVYADVAVSDACTTCHNEHKDSPKTDFKIGDTMGGVVIRVPL